MNIKDLFIVSDENNDSKKETNSKTTSQGVQFPKPSETQSSSLFPFNSLGFNKPVVNQPISSGGYSQEHFQKALDIYQNAFDSINQGGYNFHTFYQSVKQAGIDNPQMYLMAFTMGQAMEKNITKSILIEQGEYYVNKINEVYNDYVAKGNEKKNQIVLQKNTESQNLTNELNLMEQQLEALKVQIQDRKNKLSMVDSKFDPQISEIESKLLANDSAKNEIVNSIKTVQNGILTNLK